MPGPRPFTEHLKRILTAARDEAAEQGHESIETEHLLVALSRETEGVATVVLENLGVRAPDVREAVARTVARGTGDAHKWDLPYGQRAKHTISLAMQESASLNHGWLGSEHLLLGLTLEVDGVASGLLASFGATAARVRAEIIRLVDPPGQVA